MNDDRMSDLFTRLSQTLSRALLRYGQVSAGMHHGALAVWPLCIGALWLALWIWPTQDRIHALEAQLRAGTIELRGLDERRREAQALTHALHALNPINPLSPPNTAATATPPSAPDPWPYLQGLAHARAVHLLDYTPLPANAKPDGQRLRLKMHGAPLAVQGLLQDLLRGPHSVERFTLTPDDRGMTTLSLQVCIRGAESHPVLTNTPTAALFQARPKVVAKPRTALEELPLSAYRVIAVGRAEHDHYALVRTPAGKTHTIRPGMRLGDRNARVLAILPNGIEVQQDTGRQSLLIGNPP